MKNIKMFFLVLIVLLGMGHFALFVNAQAAAPTVTLTATPQNFSGYQGLSTNFTLTWSSTGTSQCTVHDSLPNGAGTIYLYPLDQNWPISAGGPTSGSSSFLFANSTGPADMPFKISCYSSLGTWIDSSIIVKYTPIATPPITITTPSAGDSWQVGSAQTITWTFPDAFSTDTTSVAGITLTGTDGKIYLATSTPTISNTGSYSWDGSVYTRSGVTITKTTIPAGSYTMNVTLTGTHTGTVMPGHISFSLTDSGSGGGSTTTPTITITSPLANSTWASGSVQTIRWQTTGLASTARGQVFITKNDAQSSVMGTQTRYLVVSNVPNIGNYTWSSVGSVYAVDKTIHTSFYDQCTETSPAWSCYTMPTTLPAGPYSVNVWFLPADLIATNPYGGFSAPVIPITIGTAGSVSTPPVNPPSVPPINPPSTPPTTPPAFGCSGGNLFNTQTGQLCNVPAVPVLGCSGGNIYNTQTGQLCVNNTNQNPSVSSYYFGTTTLKNGSTGDAVKELQRFLNDKLGLGLVVDGKLGPRTIAVVKQWQSDNGLTPDGLFGARSIKKAIEN